LRQQLCAPVVEMTVVFPGEAHAASSPLVNGTQQASHVTLRLQPVVNVVSVFTTAGHVQLVGPAGNVAGCYVSSLNRRRIRCVVGGIGWDRVVCPRPGSCHSDTSLVDSGQIRSTERAVY
jgi:hypothetical protein